MEDQDNEGLVIRTTGTGTVYCYHAIMTTSAGIWLGENPFHYTLPLLLFQITITFFVTRLTHAALRHLGQPVVISQIIGGVILGPSMLGRHKGFHHLMSSPKSREQFNTVAFIAFTLFLFVTGVKTDLGMVRKAGKKAVAIAVSGTLLPLGLIQLIGWAMRPKLPNYSLNMWILTTISTTWCFTSYTVLSCALDELNLLTSKLGRLAMSASLIADFFNTLASSFFIAYSLASSSDNPILGVKAMGAFICFIAFIIFVLRPGIMWMMRRTPEGRLLDEGCFAAIMFSAIGCGFLSEMIGFHASMGPFFLGLVLPGGPPLGATMVDRLDRLISGVLLPSFLASAGLRMDLTSLVKVQRWGVLETFIFICIAGKFIGTVAPCIYCRMPIRDALAVGLMMNCKGIREVDSANQWQNSQLITQQQHTIMILSVLFFGGTVAPLVKFLYRPEDRFIAYKRRTIQHSKHVGELHILTGIHNQEQVSSIVSLLEASHPVALSPICIYVLHLTPLAGRSAAILLPYKHHRSLSSSAVSESDHIIKAFFHLEQQVPGCLSVLPYICISPYATMHNDVCSLALDKKATLVILPFHCQIAIDGTVQTVSAAIQSVNIHVLKYAPCSVAILIDHGLVGRTTGGGRLADNVAVYFLGGPDDREALAYAARMAHNPTMRLTVVRFRLRNGWDGEETLDNEAMEEFRHGSMDGERVVYREEVVQDSEGTAGVIRAMSSKYSLLIVGRRKGQVSPLTEGLEVWSEYPELGVIGDMLVSTDFGGKVSTLVVQQQTRVGSSWQLDSPRARQQVSQVVLDNEEGEEEEED